MPMRLIALVFLVVYLLNLVPAFAPPTWMVFSFLGFRNGSSHVTLVSVHPPGTTCVEVYVPRVTACEIAV